MPVAAGFIYLSNSQVSHLEWLITDRDVKIKNMLPLINSLKEKAIESGCPLIMTSFDINQKGSDKLELLYNACSFRSVGTTKMMVIASDEDIQCFLCENKG